MSPVPTHVKWVVGLVEALLVTAGSRDIFFPGMGLPGMPDDDKVIGAVFGSYPNVGSCGKKEVGCIPGRMLFLSQCWGCMVVTIALLKLVTVFSNPEGTFLRRNLFIVFGLMNLLMGGMILMHEPYFVSQGASALGFFGAFAVEGLVLVADGMMRDRKAKKVK
mmetsp:Transcript_28800/g.73954  ORF Transcript_28800/g.73954 Transcript_28800/m.73954 type:complete len:163 (+) Transcript_28800:16-504(+)|eukprot:CAMPEP_0115849156 /NCGR_PEP_ID=MMETSP0287-20121206/11303_1 /TAXON_ID=412157 /ORGANISM="Chrysochromulina rotalis, Strain UIO044" /LENGTH=162 /DNA_ID=CAMNT_0003303113 /DNA_START=13 /DNA_END=501 /DNA_ORIENTATION=+